jgi:hypothetical protein
MAYQPTWIRGAESGGDRACADRYAVIRQVVEPYTRQLTVWDLGASLGYFGLRLAHDFGCVSIMVDGRPALIDVCRENGLPTTVAMVRRLSVEDLREVSAAVIPDVVLCLNLLHHFEDWREALQAVLNFGGEILIETPGEGDKGSANYEASQALLDALEAEQPETLATFPSHVTPGVRRPLYRLSRPKSCLTAPYAYQHRVRRRGKHPVRPHVVTATPSDKVIVYADGESRPWIPGINVWNWAQLGGAYPTRTWVSRYVEQAHRLLKAPHGDFRPWNLILQGHQVIPIDSGHRQSVDDATGLAETLRWIAHPSMAWGRCA